MCLLLPSPPQRSMELALLHDLAECLVGDIAPDDGVSKVDKQRLEHEAIEQLASQLAQYHPPSGQRLLDLFAEYEARATPEARAVKDLDLLDMILQAHEYEQVFGMDLSDFFEGTPPSRFQTPALRALAHEVHDRRCAVKQSTEELPSSPSDAAFVQEYAKASKLDAASITEVVRALRGWESR